MKIILSNDLVLHRDAKLETIIKHTSRVELAVEIMFEGLLMITKLRVGNFKSLREVKL